MPLHNQPAQQQQQLAQRLAAETTLTTACPCWVNALPVQPTQHNQQHLPSCARSPQRRQTAGSCQQLAAAPLQHAPARHSPIAGLQECLQDCLQECGGCLLHQFALPLLLVLLALLPAAPAAQHSELQG